MRNYNIPPKALHISLWILQVLLAGVYLMAGFMKATQLITQLSQTLPWVAEYPEALVRFIGVAEIAGGAGLILPAILRIRPSLVPLAATGLALIQIFAALFHVSRGELAMLGANSILLIIAIFIAWGRFYKYPFSSKA
jgi:putative oxidoreductase